MSVWSAESRPCGASGRGTARAPGVSTMASRAAATAQPAAADGVTRTRASGLGILELRWLERDGGALPLDRRARPQGGGATAAERHGIQDELDVLTVVEEAVGHRCERI